MSRRSLPLAVGVIALGLLPQAARAADMLPPPMLESAPAVVGELGTGWYLRGDLGAVAYSDVTEERYGARTPPRSKVKLDDAWSVGAGVGYKFNGWFRTDVTVDWRTDAQYTAQSRFSRVDPVRFGSTGHWGDLETTTALFNSYIDLGAWHGISPYVGAGLGLSQTRMQHFLVQDNCGFGCDPLGLQPKEAIPPGNRLHFAWAAMAGVAIDVGAGFKLDLGYRYVSLGDARTKLDRNGRGYRFEPMDAHEARVGFRYMID